MVKLLVPYTSAIKKIIKCKLKLTQNFCSYPLIMSRNPIQSTFTSWLDVLLSQMLCFLKWHLRCHKNSKMIVQKQQKKWQFLKYMVLHLWFTVPMAMIFSVNSTINRAMGICCQAPNYFTLNLCYMLLGLIQKYFHIASEDI
jgi:hypothetical protein